MTGEQRILQTKEKMSVHDFFLSSAVRRARPFLPWRMAILSAPHSLRNLTANVGSPPHSPQLGMLYMTMQT